MYGMQAVGWTKVLLLATLLVTGTFRATAQDDAMPEKDTRPVKNTFESIWLMDAQTVMVPIKGTLQMDFQHRFGTWNNGYDDFWGIFAASNIRLGIDYVPIDRLMVGFGLTKDNVLWDFWGKYALLRQGRSGGSPISMTYYVNAAADTRAEEKTPFDETSDRWSFFHQLMVARKFGNDFSVQASGNLSWFNFQPETANEQGELGRNKNAMISASVMARYKISNSFALTAAFDLPITDQAYFNPYDNEPTDDPNVDPDERYTQPNLSLGIELTTSSHAFQVFVGNFKSLVPQYNHMYNPNCFGNNEILIGFNITRLWNL